MRGVIFAALGALAQTVTANWPEAEGREIRYTSIKGYFLQDEPDTNPVGFDYADWNFGLINRTYRTDENCDPDGTKTQWQRFARWVTYLNSQYHRSKHIRYKVLIMGRHGQGYHNVAESYYGTPAWNCYWAELSGNGTSTWEDPLLTPDGFAEAEKANAYFKSRYEDEGMPFFESFYSSPLKRCILTANTTFATLDLPREHPFNPTIKEGFREGISIHTCDHRSTKAEIHEFAPSWRFEDGFTEADEQWRAKEGETKEHQLARSKAALDDVFRTDNATWISITSHSGEISKLLPVLGHRDFSLGTGQLIPVLVKAELVSPEPTTSYIAFTSEATCNAPPVTSVEGKGCVCSDDSSRIAAVAAAATPTAAM